MVIWPQVTGNTITGGMWIELVVGKGVKVYRTLNGSYVAGSTKTITASVLYNKPLEVWVNRDAKAPKSGHTRWHIWINKTKIGYYDLQNSGLTTKSGLGLFARGKSIARFNYAGVNFRNASVKSR